MALSVVAARAMIEPLVQSADFERVLRTRKRVSTQHFALHHLADRPSKVAKASTEEVSVNFSTAGTAPMPAPVDEWRVSPSKSLWLGTVVPKRHARRSVTRTLLKRQICMAVNGQAETLAGGLWVVRLRAPFDRSRFVSAASNELKRAVREELEGLIGSVVQHVVADA